MPGSSAAAAASSSSSPVSQSSSAATLAGSWEWTPAFAHDAEAATRISGWLQQLGVDDQIYHATVSSLSLGRRLSDSALPSLHAYVGVGARGAEHYASVYLNPGPALERA